MSAKENPGGSYDTPKDTLAPASIKDDEQDDNDCLIVPMNVDTIDLVSDTVPHSSSHKLPSLRNNGSYTLATNQVPVIVNGFQSANALSPPKRKSQYAGEPTTSSSRCFRGLAEFSPPQAAVPRPLSSDMAPPGSNQTTFFINRSPQRNPELVHLLTQQSKSPPFPSNNSRPTTASPSKSPSNAQAKASNLSSNASQANGQAAAVAANPFGNVQINPLNLQLYQNGVVLVCPLPHETHKCVLCWESALPKDPVVAECSHTFCSKCLVIACRAKGLCPICSRRLNMNHTPYQHHPQPHP